VRNAGILLIVFAVLGLLLDLVLVFAANSVTADGGVVKSWVYPLAYAQFALSAGQAVAGIFLLQGKEWARITGLVVTGLNLLAFVYSLISGSGFSATGLAFNGIVMYLLTKKEVREWCS
jgi:hypothetical protein